MIVTLSSEVRVNCFFVSLLGSDLMRRPRTGTQVRKRSASFRKVARQKKIEEQKDKEVEREEGSGGRKGVKGGEGGVRGKGRKEGGGKGKEEERGGGGGRKEGLQRQRETRVNGFE